MGTNAASSRDATADAYETDIIKVQVCAQF
jgi:hypothetical protein